MTLVPIELPPGMFKTATPYSAKDRWADGNLVRWHDGSLRPIGGWSRRRNDVGGVIAPLFVDTVNNTVRDVFAWTSNSNATWYVFGANSGMHTLDSFGNVFDITPVGFVGGPNNPTVNTGYGKGLYGVGYYGTPRHPSGSTQSTLFRWAFSAWGQDLIAGHNDPEYRGGIYSWTIGDANAVLIPNAPTFSNGSIITDQRILVSIGSNIEPRRVEWSDRENREVWDPLVTNQAGSDILQGAGALLGIYTVLNHSLILSQTDAHTMQYIGSPYIHRFDKVGVDCGTIHAGAVQGIDRFVMWMGRRNFWMYDGTVRKVNCEVMDFLEDDLSKDNYAKVTSGIIPQFSEIWWMYQSVGGTEVDSYVTFDYISQHWTTGRLDRTALGSSHGLNAPLMINAASEIFTHEQASIIAEGAYAETGPLAFNQGDKNLAVRFIFPDTQTTDDVDYTLLGRSMPTAPEHSYGPYPQANPTPTRAIGRELRMRVTGKKSRWEVGAKTRFDVAPVGTGMR